MGYSTLKTCTLDIASYLDAETAPLQKFYDLYLVDADGALVPTVTKLINYRDSRSREYNTPSPLGPRAGCFLAPGSGLRLVGIASARR